MINKNTAQRLKDSWKDCNDATVGFADSVPEEQWHSKAFKPRFRSFSWEFVCLTRARLCYLKGLKTGKLLFSSQPDIPEKKSLEEEPRNEIIAMLKKASVDLLKEIEKVDTPEKVDLIVWLLQHERIHHGKLLLYCVMAGLRLPKSFVETWGESNFPGY